MRQLTQHEIKSAGAILALRRVIPITLTALLLMFVSFLISAKAESWALFIVLFIASIAIPRYLFITISVNGIVKRANAAFKRMHDAINGQLEHIDYYNCGESSAIGVDVNNKHLATTSLDSNRHDVKTLLITPNKIKHYRAFSPGATTTEVIGDAPAAVRAEVFNKNYEAQAKSRSESGLYFDLDDIHMPNVFVQMKYNDAEKWMLIIEKLLDNTLDRQPSTMYYPSN